MVSAGWPWLRFFGGQRDYVDAGAIGHEAFERCSVEKEAATARGILDAVAGVLQQVDEVVEAVVLFGVDVWRQFHDESGTEIGEDGGCATQDR